VLFNTIICRYFKVLTKYQDDADNRIVPLLNFHKPKRRSRLDLQFEECIDDYAIITHYSQGILSKIYGIILIITLFCYFFFLKYMSNTRFHSLRIWKSTPNGNVYYISILSFPLLFLFLIHILNIILYYYYYLPSCISFKEHP
jgi:uncharacterized BrkB/YihY/UPF0761 family membrane protein